MQTGNWCLRDALSLSAGVAIGAAVAFAAARRTTTVAHRVHQTILEPPHGNALQACAASILGLPLNLVPNFVVEVDCWDAMLRFAALRGLTLIKVNLDGGLLPHKTAESGHRRRSTSGEFFAKQRALGCARAFERDA
jgi:hypothetical protein